MPRPCPSYARATMGPEHLESSCMATKRKTADHQKEADEKQETVLKQAELLAADWAGA